MCVDVGDQCDQFEMDQNASDFYIFIIPVKLYSSTSMRLAVFAILITTCKLLISTFGSLSPILYVK